MTDKICIYIEKFFTKSYSYGFDYRNECPLKGNNATMKKGGNKDG